MGVSGLPPGWQYAGELLPDEDGVPTQPIRRVEGSLKSFEDVFEGIASECLDLLVYKQRSYGPKNVESLGFYGVFDRLASDKVERLRNAMVGRVEKGRVIIDFKESLTDESVEDTLKDMVNYGLILIALKRGLWGAPLAEDLGR